MVICLAPVDSVDAEPFTDISGEKYVIKTGADGTYNIIYDDPALVGVEEEISIEFEAKLVDSKGNTQSNGVSPSSGDLENDTAESLRVTAPKTSGTYTLVVDFHVEVGEKDTDGYQVNDVTEKRQIKVVDPITLTVTLKGDLNSNIDPSGVGVFFYVDGEKYDDSYTTFTLNTDGTARVTYELVDDLSRGSHTFWVETAEGSNVMVDGLGDEHTFYVGEKSYTVWIALIAVILLIVIIAFVWVYRKPVKNYGKPKARR